MIFNKNKQLENMKEEIGDLLEEWRKFTLCFTGHRSQKLPWGFNEKHPRCKQMKETAKQKVENAILQGYIHFISGMAIGFDMICAEIVLGLKKKYPHISLECAIPCKGQEKKWNSELQKRYRNIVKQADKIRCLYDSYDEIGPECMLERNRYMINNSSMVIALFDGKPGGTAKTIEYAKQKGLNIEIIEP